MDQQFSISHVGGHLGHARTDVRINNIDVFHFDRIGGFGCEQISGEDMTQGIMSDRWNFGKKWQWAALQDRALRIEKFNYDEIIHDVSWIVCCNVEKRPIYDEIFTMIQICGRGPLSTLHQF